MAGAEETADGGPAGAAKGCDPPPSLQPRSTPPPRPGAAPSRASEQKPKKEKKHACVFFFLFFFVLFFWPRSRAGFKISALSRREDLLASPLFSCRPTPSLPPPLLGEGGGEGVSACMCEGNVAREAGAVGDVPQDPRPRAPPPYGVPYGGGRTRGDPCAGCALAVAPPSRGPKPHDGATRSAAACDGNLLPESAWGKGVGEGGGEREKRMTSSFFFFPLTPPLSLSPLRNPPGRDGPSRGRVAGGSGHADAFDRRGAFAILAATRPRRANRAGRSDGGLPLISGRSG